MLVNIPLDFVSGNIHQYNTACALSSRSQCFFAIVNKILKISSVIFNVVVKNKLNVV